MSLRLAATLAALACAAGPLAVAPAALAAPAGRNNDHDCGVFDAHDEAIQGNLDAINDVVAGYYTSWVGNSFFGDEQYGEIDPEDMDTVLSATSALSATADAARRSVQTRGATLALDRIANDSRAVHDTAAKINTGEYRPRQLGFAKDVLFRSMNNYHNAYSLACNGDIVDPQF